MVKRNQFLNSNDQLMTNGKPKNYHAKFMNDERWYKFIPGGGAATAEKVGRVKRLGLRLVILRWAVLRCT